MNKKDERNLLKKGMTKKAYNDLMKSRRAGACPKPTVAMTSKAQKRQNRSACKAALKLVVSDVE